MNGTRFLLAIPNVRDASGAEPIPLTMLDDVRHWRAASATLWTTAHCLSPTKSAAPAGAAILIGYAVRRDGTSTGETIDLRSHGSIREAVEHLSNSVWGAYLAILPSCDGRRLHLFRDPAGGLPVYRHETGTHILFTSDMRLLAEAGVPAPAVNWEAVHAQLKGIEKRFVTTCLTGVTELPPGLLVDSRQKMDRGERIWTPWAFTSPARLPTFEQAASELRNVILETVDAWATACGKVVVPVSGGVDSSIICAALAARGHDFSCVTIATSDPSGDERPYARSLARHLRVPLAERFYDVDRVDPLSTPAAHLPRPVFKPFMQETHRIFQETASQVQAAHILDGNGGDNIFCFIHSSAPITDRLARLGFGYGTISTLVDTAALTGCTIPSLVRLTLLRKRAARIDRPADHSFLASNSVGDIGSPGSEAMLEPYLATCTETQRGKIAHVALLLAIRNYVEGFDRSKPFTLSSPLLSQPIVEACLAVPTWDWCRGGINRAVARAAFANLLPREITSRLSKAGPDSFVHAIMRRHRATIRSAILDGLLASRGVIDRRAIEAFFASSAQMDEQALDRMLVLANAEAWVRHWHAIIRAPHG